MKKIIIIIVTLFLFSCQSENQKQNIVKKIIKQEISEKAVVKTENNSNLIIEEEKSEWSFFDWEIKFTKCDNLAKYKNKELFFKTDENLETIYNLINLEKYSKWDIIEYCKNWNSRKYIFVFDWFYWKKIYQYDSFKKIVYKSKIKWFFNKNSIETFYTKKRDRIRNYWDDSLKKFLEKYIKSKENIAWFWLKYKNIIPYSVYWKSLIWCAECAPWVFSSYSQFFSDKTREYCETWLTEWWKLSVCFADIFYEYDYVKNEIEEKRVCSYYISDNWNIETLEKCFDIKNNKNWYNLKSKTKWIDFYQDETWDLSILDIDLGSAKISFGWVNIDEKYIEEFERFNKSYAKNLEYNHKKFHSYGVVNWQFFTNVKNKETALSFPVKSEWKIITDYMDNEIPKRTFITDKNWEAKILEWYKKEFLEDKNNEEVIVAFTPEVRARRNSKIWRTYIWLLSSKNIVFFIAKNKTQKQMNKIISDYWIKSENIIMMDWWPSSQFAYYENNWPWSGWEQFYWKWEVPHYFIVYKN